MNKFEIFKVQRPMSQSSGLEELALVYNKSRSQYGQLPMTQELKDLMGKDYKIYVTGKIAKDGTLQIKEKAPSQRW